MLSSYSVTQHNNPIKNKCITVVLKYYGTQVLDCIVVVCKIKFSL